MKIYKDSRTEREAGSKWRGAAVLGSMRPGLISISCGGVSLPDTRTPTVPRQPQARPAMSCRLRGSVLQPCSDQSWHASYLCSTRLVWGWQWASTKVFPKGSNSPRPTHWEANIYQQITQQLLSRWERFWVTINLINLVRFGVGT